MPGMSDAPDELGKAAEARHAHMLRRADGIAAARKATGEAKPCLAALTRRTDAALSWQGRYPDERAISLDLRMARRYLAKALGLINELLADEWRG